MDTNGFLGLEGKNTSPLTDCIPNSDYQPYTDILIIRYAGPDRIASDYVKGAGAVQAALEKELEVRSGETRADGKASLQTARCLGACGLAPAVVFDGSVAGNVNAERARSLVKGWIDDGSR